MNAKSTAGCINAAPDLQTNTKPVIELSPLPMLKLEGRDYRVCFVNAAFCRLVQKKPRELIGKPFIEIVSNGQSCVPLLDLVNEAEEPDSTLEPDEREANPSCWLTALWPALEPGARSPRVVLQLTKSAYSHQTAAAMNEALLVSGLHQLELREAAEKSNVRLQLEITDHKLTEQALQSAQAKLRADADKLEDAVAERTTQLRATLGELEAFSYSLAHDLRAPLRAIHGFTQFALELPRDEVAPSAVALLNRVITAAIRMDSLIQDVLSVSHVISRPITVESIDVDALVHTLVEERPELSPPRVQITIESPLLRMLGHEAFLSQCLTNLLSNAVKFVERGVVPRVRVWSEDRGTPVPVKPEAAGAAEGAPGPAPRAIVRLWVEDNGIGIAPDAHRKIFEIFQRLNSSPPFEGSGIGLAIVRKAIERMGGQVGVESETGKGSRFWLELPKG